MNNEFKKSTNGTLTRYVLESATSGGTSAGSVASSTGAIGGVQRRNNLIVQDDTVKVPVTQKPRQGALRTQTGAGAHRDKKKEQKQGKEKHKKPYMEELKSRLDILKNKLGENSELAQQMLALAKLRGMNARIAGTPEQERERTQQMMAQRAKEREEQGRQAAQADADKLPELKAEYEAMKKKYDSLGGSNWQYADREQNLSNGEREARSMEPKLRDLANRIHRAENVSEDHSDVGGWGQGSYDTYSGTRHGRGVMEDEYLNHLDSLLEEKQRLDPKCWTGYKKQGTKMKGGVRVNNCVPKEDVDEDWQKVNKKDKTDGMSRKAVKAYRRENPGSKLKTAVTTKPSKLKKGGKAAKRRKSFCARMSGMKKAHASAKTKRDPDSPINKALRRWNCHEDAYILSIAQQVSEKLNPQADVDVWVQDFQKADPNKYKQFKNKTPQKKAQMAVAAHYAANEPSKKK